jgi:hypothetical protein
MYCCVLITAFHCRDGRSSQVSQNKHERDEYWNGGMGFPNPKRTNIGRFLHESDIMDLLEKIDNMDAINSISEETHTVIQLQVENLNGVMKYMKDEVGLMGQADDVDGKGSSAMGSIRQGEITDGNFEATLVSLTADIYLEGNLTYYDDVSAELGFFVDHTAVEFAIMMDLFDGNLMANIMYSDPVYNTETVYGSLWEDDIWQWNERPVIQNVFASPQQEESGFSGPEFPDI